MPSPWVVNHTVVFDWILPAVDNRGLYSESVSELPQYAVFWPASFLDRGLCQPVLQVFHLPIKVLFL